MSDAAMAAPSPEFIAGFSARHTDSVGRLQRAMAAQPVGFAPADLIARLKEAFGDQPPAEPGSARPRGYTPADRDADPVEGWNPLDADAEPSPFIDPVEEARQAGYDAGFAAARAQQADAAERDRAMLARLVEALRADARIDREKLAKHLRQTVMHLVTQLVGEAGVSAALLSARVKAATELLADAAESAILRVNPADVPLLEGHLPATVFPVGDANVARGSFVMEAASTSVEDGPGLWLEQLAQTLDKVALPGGDGH
ncbi:MAG: FliH/SctL family protein [Sphingomonas bacterium]